MAKCRNQIDSDIQGNKSVYIHVAAATEAGMT